MTIGSPVGTVTATLDRANKVGDRTSTPSTADAARLLPTFARSRSPAAATPTTPSAPKIYMVVGPTGVYILDTTNRHRHRFRLRVHRQLGQLSVSSTKTTGRIIVVGPTTAGRSTMRVGVIDVDQHVLDSDQCQIQNSSSDELPRPSPPDRLHPLPLRPHPSDPHDIDTGQHHHHDPSRPPPRATATDAVPGRIQRLGVGTVRHRPLLSPRSRKFDPRPASPPPHHRSPGSGGARSDSDRMLRRRLQ